MCKQLRAHVVNGCPHGVTLLAKDVPEDYGAGAELKVLESQLLHALNDGRLVAPGLADASQVALDVSHEYGHSKAAEPLRKRLEGHGLASAGGAGNEAVA